MREIKRKLRDECVKKRETKNTHEALSIHSGSGNNSILFSKSFVWLQRCYSVHKALSFGHSSGWYSLFHMHQGNNIIYGWIFRIAGYGQSERSYMRCIFQQQMINSHWNYLADKKRTIRSG